MNQSPSVCRMVGDYELLEELGRGCSGTVWCARRLCDRRLSAVKIFHRAPEDAYAEAGAYASLAPSFQGKHPHIVPVLDWGHIHEDGGRVRYVVYELIQGVTLKEWTTFAPLHAREAATLVAKLASALSFAHQQGVVHRDLKPDNILMDLSGEPHLTDFGPSRRRAPSDGDTRAAALRPLAYIAPEQVLGAKGDERADIFSLGVILYELLTDELPFPALTIPGYLALLAQSPLGWPPNRRRSAPRELKDICERCLKRYPADRYASAAEVAEYLQRFVDECPAESPQPSEFAGDTTVCGP